MIVYSGFYPITAVVTLPELEFDQRHSSKGLEIKT
jgi:hypothetical protein